MTEIRIEELLKEEGPIALIVKQILEPVDSDDPVIFPPTYPMTKWNGRVHTIRDGEYRVTVELPSGSKTDKDEKKDNQKPGYQIDQFPDGTNICEIDSPQSQSNRIEPKFKTIAEGKLVPQIVIQVGTEKVNLLDVGHRAGDAVVRMSSLAAEIHDAFIAAKSNNFFKLATIAPTSLVFGVWDSRSTYVKQQRILKAHIRATNVRELSRSAQYTPAIAYVDARAIGEDVEVKKGDESNLSQEGMVHALSTQSVGGVLLTDTSQLVRTVTVNLEAIRVLQGKVPVSKSSLSEGDTCSGNEIDGTEKLRKYIFGLALVAALNEPDLNLREGCHLKYKGKENTSINLVYRSKESEKFPFSDQEVLKFANTAKDEFFKLAGIDEQNIDHRDAMFESGIAEKFLAYIKEDRDKIRKLGPITNDTLTRFESQSNDPFKTVTDELKKVKEILGKKPGKKEKPVKNNDAFKSVYDCLKSLSNNKTLPDGAAKLASDLSEIAQDHDNSHDALKKIEDEIKVFKRALKEGISIENSNANAEVNK